MHASPNARAPRCSARWRRPGRSSGQALVELALVTPILLSLLLIAIDAGQLMYVYIGVQNAAREGASYASTNPKSCPTACTLGTTDPIYLRVQGELNSGSHGSTPTVSVQSANATPGTQITVIVSTPFNMVTGGSKVPGVGGISFPSFTITSSATAVIQ
jgi:Flp pilus assembly protein TadG